MHRAGHCTFTSAEMVMAIKKLVGRLDSGSWGDLSPGAMNGGANKLLGLNTRRTIYNTWTLRTNPAFIDLRLRYYCAREIRGRSLRRRKSPPTR